MCTINSSGRPFPCVVCGGDPINMPCLESIPSRIHFITTGEHGDTATRRRAGYSPLSRCQTCICCPSCRFPVLNVSIVGFEPASYLSGNGTPFLIFLYTVQPGDRSSDLEYWDVEAMKTNGSIRRVSDEVGCDCGSLSCGIMSRSPCLVVR